MNSVTSYRILLVDDEAIVRESLASWLEGEGYAVFRASSGREAISLVEENPVDIALIDLKMPEMDGIETLQEIRRISPDTLCLILTAHATVHSAVEAMKQGAYDYIVKPFNPDEVSLAVERLGAHLSILKENALLKSRMTGRASFHALMSRSESMLRLFEMARRVARSRTTVLILGESGTGKELLARAIHEESPRQSYPFVPVSCAALSETLLEDEIFGHEKGAFTDAREARKGKFELADHGTLFLDEIGDISPKLQLDLLRVLQEKEFTRLGGTRTLRVDVRIISATNRDIEHLVHEGAFRDDLFYRLNVITLTIPPLRNRKEDIPFLVHHFLGVFSKEMGLDSGIRIHPEAMKTLTEYDYPGNVRELQGAVEHAMILCGGDMIRPEDLPARVRGESEGPLQDESHPLSLEEMERSHIMDILSRYDHNISQCARLLGIDRSTLYAKIHKYGLRREDEE